MARITEFDVLWRDILAHTIRIEGSEVTITHHTKDKAAIQFWFDEVTLEEVLTFLRDRCFPETRDGKERILEALGLESYNIWDILEIKHGVMYDDFVWIRFKGEELCWDDVRIR